MLPTFGARGQIPVVELVQEKLEQFMEPQFEKADELCKVLTREALAITTLSVPGFVVGAEQGSATDERDGGTPVRVGLSETLRAELTRLTEESVRLG